MSVVLHDWLGWVALAWLAGSIVTAWRTGDSVWNGWRVAMVVAWPVYVVLWAITFVGLLLQDAW